MRAKRIFNTSVLPKKRMLFPILFLFILFYYIQLLLVARGGWFPWFFFCLSLEEFCATCSTLQAVHVTR
jgi:hypothetical protein